jgi:hypothetical protein
MAVHALDPVAPCFLSALHGRLGIGQQPLRIDDVSR